MHPFFPALRRGLVSLFLPTRCPHCDRRVEQACCACPECAAEIQRLAANVDALPCVPDLLAAAPLEGVVRSLIHRMKYQGHLPAVQLVGRMMARTLATRWTVPASTLLVPVPLHPVRQRQRGFNQAERLADVVAALTGLTVHRGLLERIRWGGSLTSLEIEARRAAVAGAFRVRRLPPSSPILLVDDVWTTGATGDACRLALRQAGKRGPIRFLVAARTPARRPARLPD